MNRILITGGSGFIGTSLIDAFLEQGERDLLNLDIAATKVVTHEQFLVKCDLLNRACVLDAFQKFRPTHVVHLGGRTDMFGETLDDYAANHVGTSNVIQAIQHTPSVERVIFTSSQFVVGPGALPKNDLDFRPHTIYGQSKVKSEEAVNAAELNCTWTIIRPTNIWGKWHPRYSNEFWLVLKQGRYVHPGGKSVRRCYGYVGTIVEQIQTILSSKAELVDRTVLYVGDAPIDLYDWTNAFSLELVGHPVRVVPRAVLRTLALIGDLVIACGGKFPIFSSRYRSMTEEYVTPMQKTFDVLGVPSITLNQGVKTTVEWLRSIDPYWR
jgi:nucleoside-diphosphate-sugar epimerase